MYKLKDIPSIYRKKLVTPDEAAAVVKEGDRIYYGLGLGTVDAMDKALARRADTLKDVEIVSTVAIRDGQYEVFKATQDVNKVRFASAHMSKQDRDISKHGECWFVPMNFNELPSYWGQNNCGFNIAMLQVCPMDRFGMFNVGPQAGDTWSVVKNCDILILEVNENMPYAHGVDCNINLQDVDYVVHGDNPKMKEIASGEPTEIDKQIAKFVVEKIGNDSTLQLGIGALPSTIGKLLAESDVKNIGGHTEMLVDGYLELFKAGKLANDKNLDEGKIVYTFAGGSQDLYDFIDDNPICHTAPVDYVNNQHTISRIDNFVSVNSCINLDLYGQVCSEMSQFSQISGTGGQLDFVMGAYHSKGGQSFICVPSTRVSKSGERSSLIVPALSAGSVVTTPRSATHYIVTEYGAANLKGKSTWERAELLINIAHPDFREELIKDAEKMGIWTRTSKASW